MNPKDDLAEAVSGIRSPDVVPNTADLVRKIVDQGEASQLVSAIISAERLTSQNEEHAIERTMHHLESFGGTARILACVLMCDLWGIAGVYVGMHEVCDAIDLWLDDCDSTEITRHLEVMVLSESDPKNRRHYEQLIKFRNHSTGAKEP